MQSASPDRPGSEIPALTGFRALPALAVVVFHFLREHVPRSWPRLRQAASTGYVAVGLFFVLSGFVLTYTYAARPLDEEGRRRFRLARFARIYPVYLLSLALGFAAEWPRSFAALHTEIGWIQLGLVLLLLNALTHFGMLHLNWAAWSLSVEAFFYALFPWLTRRLAARRLADLALIALAAWLFGLAFPAAYTALDPDDLGTSLRLIHSATWSQYLRYSPLTHLHEFVIGIVAGLYFLRRRAAGPTSPHLWDAATLVLAALVAFALARSDAIPYAYVHSGLLAPLFAALVIAVAGGHGWVSRALATRPMLELGRASYAIYILHVPVHDLMARAFPRLDRDPRWVLLYIALLVVLCVAVYHLIEEPARRRIRSAITPARDRDHTRV